MTDQADPRIVAVVVTFNRSALLGRLLARLGEVPEVAEILVVDNGSTDDSALIAAKYCTVVSSAERGIGKLRNAGALQHPRAGLLAFVDADCEVQPGWLRAGLRAMETSTLVGSRTRAPDDAGWTARRWAAIEARQVHDASLLWTQHLMVDRVAFDGIGGFSRELRTGEDADFCLRLRRSGATLRHVADMQVIHHGFPTSYRAFLARDWWHTSTPGWFRRMSSRSRLAVAVTAVAPAVALAVALTSRCRIRTLAACGSGFLAALGLAGYATGREAKWIPHDAVLTATWLAIRVVRLPTELRYAVNQRRSRRLTQAAGSDYEARAKLRTPPLLGSTQSR